MSEKILCKFAKAERGVTAVDEAQFWARDLVHRESRGPGDMENAMRRLEGRYGISQGTFWSLRYRPPKDIFVSAYVRLKAAYEAECERQKRLLEHEITITKAKCGPFSPAVRAAETLVGEE